MTRAEKMEGLSVTDIAKAREMLAAEYKADGAPWNFCQEVRKGNLNRVGCGPAIRAIVKALARPETVEDSWPSDGTCRVCGAAPRSPETGICAGCADEAITPEEAWQELIEYDDRTSPADHPNMALITRDELFDFLRRHRLGLTSPDREEG